MQSKKYENLSSGWTEDSASADNMTSKAALQISPCEPLTTAAHKHLDILS